MKGKKVLVVPLNWGLGHTTRIIPIIKLLLGNEAIVTISGSREQIALLTSEFNNLKVISLPFLKIKISASKTQILAFLLQMPRFLIQIRREHIALDRILKTEHFDLIISDNCYGLWNKKVKSIIISHQLNLIVPRSIQFLNPLFNYINHKLISNFTSCWVPDYKDGPNLSGKLSHPVPKSINASYIGPLTRFSYKKSELIDSSKNKILFIISGPEIQRTLFENILVQEAVTLQNKFHCNFIRGLPDHRAEDLRENWYNHVPAKKMENFMHEADLIVCRAGYSSIMDLFVMQKRAILIPTPGQTEQEYLARYISNLGLFICQKQDEIDLKEGIKKLKNLPKTNYLPLSNETLNNVKKELDEIFIRT